ncbi:hypothetical protein B0H14DRAFT_3045599 [Mycena olivaceomarginata]|nr:hypothetical protein B0H14DRAFT_3045599 [Mycena olivaceomarginata]
MPNVEPSVPTFKEEHDDHLVAYLAEPSHLLLDPEAVSTYSDLGPKSKYAWSWGHKPDGWQRRAGTIENLREEGPQDSAGGRKEEVRRGARYEATKPQSTRKPKPQAPLPKIKFTLKKKPKTIDGVTYDVEGDITRIADDNGIHRGLAEQFFCSTGSVLEAAHLASQVRDHGLSADESADRSDRDTDEEEEYGEQEELEEEFVVAKKEKANQPQQSFSAPNPKSKPPVKRERDADDDSGDSDIYTYMQLKKKLKKVEEEASSSKKKTTNRKPNPKARSTYCVKHLRIRYYFLDKTARS